MERNRVLCCLPWGSRRGQAPSPSSNNVHASSSAHSEDSSSSDCGVEVVPSFRLVPLPGQRAYPQHTVGIDDQVNRVIQLLEWENETNAAVAVILHGLGGTGKTTLADAVVARLDIQGWNCYTVEPRAGLVRVINFEDVQEEIQDMFVKQQAFIFIDNVKVRGEHLQKLLPNNSCKKKFRLLLTARDEMVADVLKKCGIHPHVYPVKRLLFPDTMELLCKKMGVPGTMQTPQINEILKICDGVPLVLERVGAYICQSQDKDEAYRRVIEWSKDGRPFSSAEEYSIEKKGLLFDLDELPATSKETFLDICSFFNGWDWDKVSCILGEDELNNLRKRAMLLKKEECENKVMVPHIILTIGLNMTKGKRFTSVHDLSKALEGNEQGIGGIKGIWLQDNRSEPFIISARKLDLMHNSLRVLALGDMAIVVDGPCYAQEFKQLIYFQAGLIPYIPFHLTTPQELRFLDCILPHNKDDKLQLTKMSSKLKVFNLNGGGYGCQFGTQSTFGRLRGLRTFKMTKFKKLNTLPREILSLAQLEELDLSGCRKLVQLPEDLGYLHTLKKLSLRSCESLQELPGSFGKLISLKYLDLNSCTILEQLPKNFGSLSSLEELDLGYCLRLKELPTSFGKLSALKVLTLVHCRNLNHLLDDIRYLSALVRIEFQSSRFVSIPCRHIKLVKNLSSEWCRQLTNLPKRLIQVASVRSLDLYRLSSLERLPEGFGQLKSLSNLNIQWCSSLQELCSDFHCLESLQTLTLEWCETLEGKWMDSVGKIKTLELVSVQQSPMLEKRWAEMAEGGESWHFAVRGSYRKNWNWENAEKMLYKSASKLFTADCLLTDSHGEPFSLSTVEPDTVLLVLYHYPCRPNISVNYLYMWKLLEEVVKHEHPLPFQMIYVGRRSEELSKGLAERIMAYASVDSDGHDSDAHLFFKKAFNDKVASSIDSPNFVVTKVVADEEGRKHFATWENKTHSLVNFLLSRSTLYSHLKKLTKTPQESNLELLSALFDTTESTSSIFVRNYTENIGVDQLHGKTVLLLISIMDEHHVMDEQLFQSLTEIYLKAETSDDMEILSIPIPAEVRGEHPTQKGSDLAGFESTLRVPWPVLRNPWLLKTEVYYFFKKKWSEFNPAMLVVVEPNGRIRIKNALPLIKKWGAEFYPFTEEKMEQLEQQTPQLSEEESQTPQLNEEDWQTIITPLPGGSSNYRWLSHLLGSEQSIHRSSTSAEIPRSPSLDDTHDGTMLDAPAEDEDNTHGEMMLEALAEDEDDTHGGTMLEAPADLEGTRCFPVMMQVGLVSTTDSFTLIFPPIPTLIPTPFMSPDPSYSLPVNIFVNLNGGIGRMKVEAPVDLRGTSGSGIMLPMWVGCENILEDLLTQTGTIFLPRLPAGRQLARYY